MTEFALDPRVVFTPQYDIKLPGLQQLHPFDARKYGHAFQVAKAELGDELLDRLVVPDHQISREELLQIHSTEYLDALKKSVALAGIIEVGALRYLPASVADYFILRAMRWGARGTVIGAEQAMEHGLAINLSGGYHHASPEWGEGFCVYADTALAINNLRTKGLLTENDRVLYVDCDAHQGNGVSRSFLDDERVKIFDMFNRRIYPKHDHIARERVDFEVPLEPGTDDEEYLYKLKGMLPQFIDDQGRDGRIKFALYNAGTDIYAGDKLGQMEVTLDGVFERDAFVLKTLLRKGIPTLMVPSGGYSKDSYKMIAAAICYALTDLPGEIGQPV